MSTTLIAIVTLLYIGIAVSEAVQGNHGLAMAFSGYAFSNIGLIMMASS
jgi:hypothetical protein